MALGIGIWKATPWGYKLIFITASIYTLDIAQYLLHRDTMLAGVMRQLAGAREILRMVDKDMLMNALTITTALFAAGWWGFALYAYLRRGYFRSKEKPLDE